VELSIDVIITLPCYQLKSVILILVETEPAANMNFERETAKKKPGQTRGHSGARPKIRRLTLNSADIYSKVDKRKGWCTFDYIVNYIWFL